MITEAIPNQEWLFSFTLNNCNMKTLNERAVKILGVLLDKHILKADSFDKEIQAKIIHDFGRYRIITLTLFRNEEGFQWREPELTILHDTLTDEYIASNICNDFAHINSNSVTVVYGKLTVWNDKIQCDHADYAHRVLESIAHQYGIEI